MFDFKKIKPSSLALPLFLVAFFVSVLWLVVGAGGVVNSPDESANKLFVQSFAETGSLRIHEPLNVSLGGIVHPRSMIALGEYLVPRSFSGLPVVYGTLSKIIGQDLIFYITPLIAILALLAFRSLAIFFFKKKSFANIATLMLGLHPAFWFYSARTMMHNVPFVSFLIFGAWFFITEPIKKYQLANAFAGGLMIGLALAFRTSEIIWVVATCGLMLPLAFKKIISIPQVALFGLGAFVVLLPFGFLNIDTYGSFFETGYTVEVSVQSAASSYEGTVDVAKEVDQDKFGGVLGYLFPFGIHEYAILRHVWGYGFILYPWMSGLALFGLMLTIKNWKKDDEVWRRLTLYTFLLAAWLGVVYGSWTFHDNPDPNVVTLGNSYVRYWLPLFILAAPFTARAIEFIGTKVRSSARRYVIVALVLSVALASANQVFFDPDGLVHTRQALMSFSEKRDLIIDNTEEDALIIVDRADKFLYPSRMVVTPLRSEETFSYLPLMVESAPVYYFGITLPEEDIRHLNQEQLSYLGLKAEFIFTHSDESLYKIDWVEPEFR